MTDAFTARAPGRVNLIGEHTDYNGGMVLPAALAVGLEVALVPRPDSAVAVASNGYDAPAIRDLADDAVGDWADPCVGALREANALGLLRGGATLEVQSTIPQGSGLSSSAALIVAVLKAAREAAGAGPDDVELAVAARRVENLYMGVPCGIMDQMAVALATPGTAMALDTRTLSCELVAFPRGYEMVVVHSGLTRKLTDGRYAARKAECDAAKRHFGTEDLCLLDRALVEAAELDDIPKRRTLHCLSEHARVQKAVAAMRAGDMASFGTLMNASHASMRDLFEMSLPEIDALVESSLKLGALGARLTGGGFGGCIVACVETERRETWLKELSARHARSRFIDAVGAEP
ncbi:galactokinase [Erythrobacter sp. JK5]|uniref:galactokinase n=1 Tax=Erythrobacter sp. JK5 TaxID=2829500 RepID=UPI001BACC591|nr:galactokinase [Erythrobacter sp. JK5]QUL38110.1 galactokinase [Erythrobacter sp. JK5]